MRRHKKARWVVVFRMVKPESCDTIENSQMQFERVRDVLDAMQKVRKVVRAVPGPWGTLLFYARRG